MALRVRRWSLVWLAVLGLMVAGWAAGGGTGLTSSPPPPPPPSPERVEPAPGPTVGGGAPRAGREVAGWREPQNWPVWLLAVPLLACAVALLVVIVVNGTHRVLTAPPAGGGIHDQVASQPAPAEADKAQVREAVRAGLADLEFNGDPRQAVIACWLRLEAIAAGTGAARLVADTPADLVTRLLAEHRVTPAVLAQLADAYRLARYAPAEVGPELRATARRALDGIAAELGVRRPDADQ